MQAEWLEALVRELGRQVAREAGPDLGAVVDWLGRRIDAEVAIVQGAGAVLRCTSDFPPGLTAALGDVLARLSAGQVSSVATEERGLWVRCEALGACVPRPVLVVTSRQALTSQAARMVTHAGSLIAVLHRLQRARDAALAYQFKAGQVRLAVLSALMVGDPTLARRVTAGAVPPLLEADHLRVALLRCMPGDRDRYVQTYEDRSGYHGRGLLVRCSVYDNHLIALMASQPDGANLDEADPTDLLSILRHLLRDNPHYALGVSSPHPLAAAAHAYDEARHALAVACNTPGRQAHYRGSNPLEHVLPREPALAWARSFLRPLQTAPKLTLDITRLAVSLPRSGVAQMLGISRNTVTAHLKCMEERLGLSMDDVGSRAGLALALAITSLEDETGPFCPANTPTLEDLLSTQQAGAWARTLLAPLEDTRFHRPYITLIAWIHANTDALRTAKDLRISRNTVAAHLRIVENLLTRDLLSTGAGIHDLVHALQAVGESLSAEATKRC